MLVRNELATTALPTPRSRATPQEVEAAADRFLAVSAPNAGDTIGAGNSAWRIVAPGRRVFLPVIGGTLGGVRCS